MSWQLQKEKKEAIWRHNQCLCMLHAHTHTRSFSKEKNSSKMKREIFKHSSWATALAACNESLNQRCLSSSSSPRTTQQAPGPHSEWRELIRMRLSASIVYTKACSSSSSNTLCCWKIGFLVNMICQFEEDEEEEEPNGSFGRWLTVIVRRRRKKMVVTHEGEREREGNGSSFSSPPHCSESCRVGQWWRTTIAEKDQVERDVDTKNHHHQPTTFIDQTTADSHSWWCSSSSEKLRWDEAADALMLLLLLVLSPSFHCCRWTQSCANLVSLFYCSLRTCYRFISWSLFFPSLRLRGKP